MAPLTDILFTLDRSGTNESQTTWSLSDGELVQAVSDDFVFDSRLTDDAGTSASEEDIGLVAKETEPREVDPDSVVIITSYQTGGSSGYDQTVDIFDPDFLF